MPGFSWMTFQPNVFHKCISLRTFRTRFRCFVNLVVSRNGKELVLHFTQRDSTRQIKFRRNEPHHDFQPIYHLPNDILGGGASTKFTSIESIFRFWRCKLVQMNTFFPSMFFFRARCFVFDAFVLHLRLIASLTDSFRWESHLKLNGK